MAILKTGQEIGVCAHHSVYEPANNLAELKAQASLFNTWHKAKSWAEATKTPSAYPYISYHWLMATDGSMLNVTDEKYVKYHAGDNFRGVNSFNLHGIGVCLTGNYENDVPTEAQMKSLVLFIRDVEKRYKIDALVRGHKETSADPTACPGKNIGTHTSGWLKTVISNVNNKDYPPVVTPPTEPPVPPEPTECEKQVIALQKQIDALESTTGTQKIQIIQLMTQNRSLTEDSARLNAEIQEYKNNYMQLEGKYNRVLDERNKFEIMYNEAIEELHSSNGLAGATIGELFAEIWRRITRSIK